MTWKEASFWLEAIAYDVELSTPRQEPEVHDLSELAKVLPRE